MSEDRYDLDLRRTFQALDDGDTPPPTYTDRLWSELQETLARDPAPVVPDDAVLVELRAVPQPRRRGRRRVAAIVAAASAALAVVVISASQDGPTDTVDQPAPTTTTTTTTLPVLADPTEACRRYFDSEWSIDRLVSSDLATADFDAAIAAIEQLQLDIEASGAFEDAALTTLAVARGHVVQSRTEALRGDTERAARSLDTVADFLLLHDPDDDQPRCRTSGE